MNFNLSDEQVMLKKMIREFAVEVVEPTTVERDRDKIFPKNIFNQLGDLGILGLPFPEKYGGGGADRLSFAIVVEELSRVCAST